MKFYRAESFGGGCRFCHHGERWVVRGEDGTQVDEHFDTKTEASTLAYFMNEARAFALGQPSECHVKVHSEEK